MPQITSQEIQSLRKDLGLSQIEFAQLFGSHFMTISKWERGLAAPSAYQETLLRQFQATASAEKAKASEEVKALLLGAGVISALLWLLSPR